MELLQRLFEPLGKMTEDRTQNPFFEASRVNALRAIDGGLPVFLTETARSTPVNATPYLLSYRHFFEVIARWPGRQQLGDELDHVRTNMVSLGFGIDAILIGGSFTEIANAAPADIDCLIFYRCHMNSDPARLADIQNSAREKHVDCRLVPIDGDPLVVLKLTSYFTILYSKGKSSLEIARCLLLLDCRDGP